MSDVSEGVTQNYDTLTSSLISRTPTHEGFLICDILGDYSFRLHIEVRVV